MEYDVIVAGAGPAGSTVGYELSRMGYSVLILEKETLPRDKLCAGGLPRRILKLVDLQDAQLVEDRIKKVEFTFLGKERFVLEASGPLIYTVQRRHFDHMLVRRAQSVGCHVLDGEPVKGLNQGRDGVRVRTSRGDYRGRILVGADGVGGIVARLGNFRRKRRIISTLQSDVPIPPEEGHRYRGRVWIGLGWVRNGYGWIFPKRTHLTVGMGAAVGRGRVGMFRRAFRALLRFHFPQQQDLPVASCPISVGGRRERLVQGRMLLIGEAANLVHPVTAEGIYYAMRSAQLAAEAGDDFLSGRASSLWSYQRRVDQRLGSFFHKGMIFAGLFYGLPRLSFKLFVKDNGNLIRYFDLK